jgi:hypothetical protein
MAGVNMGRFLLLMPVLGMEGLDPNSRLTAVRRRTWWIFCWCGKRLWFLARIAPTFFASALTPPRGLLSKPDVKERRRNRQGETDQNAAQKAAAELVHVRIPSSYPKVLLANPARHLGVASGRRRSLQPYRLPVTAPN